MGQARPGLTAQGEAERLDGLPEALSSLLIRGQEVGEGLAESTSSAIRSITVKASDFYVKGDIRPATGRSAGSRL